MAPLPRPQNRDEFEIAIICALPIERDAVEALLEEEYETNGFSYGKAPGDKNAYSTGLLGNQAVVLAYMPGIGTISAAAVAANLSSSFQRIKVGLVVGVCGGVPSTADGTEILLGDVIISTSVTQIDFGRQYPNKIVRKKEAEDTLGRANPEIRAFFGRLSGYLIRNRLKEKTNRYTGEICAKQGFAHFTYPGPVHDQLYPADYRHQHRGQQGQDHSVQASCLCSDCKTPYDDVCELALQSSCQDLECDDSLSIKRNRVQKAMGFTSDERRLTDIEIDQARQPSVHFGRMASSNQVTKSGQHRERVAIEEKVIGFEMEAAGTWNSIPTMVVKGVCDYADSHKNKRWQRYAAATAAACTRAILEEWRNVDRPVQNHPSQGDQGNLSGTNPIYWTVTRSPNALFTGRKSTLLDLENTVRDGAMQPTRQIPCWIVISGMGGQGKSEICLQLVQRVRNLFWGVFWVDISTSLLAENGFFAIASQLKISVQAWGDALQALSNVKEHWLLVLDNADDVNMDYRPYFPSSFSGVVLLTSRNAECQHYATAKWIDLEGLPDDEACELLLKAAHVPPFRRPVLKDDAECVARLLRSHPLGIIQAGTYVSRGHCTLKEYPQVYQRQRKRLLTFRPSQAHSRYGDIYATFEASAEILSQSNSQSANDSLQLLSILASLGPLPLPVVFFETAWQEVQNILSENDDDQDLSHLAPWHVAHLPPLMLNREWDSFRLIEAINLLKAFSLVSAYEDHNTTLSISLHPLIYAWATDRLNTREQHKAWVTSGCLVAFFRTGSVLWQKHQRSLQLHVHTLISQEMRQMFSTEPPLKIVRILMSFGLQLYKMRDHAKVFELMNGVLDYLGLDRLTVDGEWLGLYDLTARNLKDYGRSGEAVTVMKQVVNIKGLTLTEGHNSLLDSQQVLAMAYQANGQVQEAVTIMEHVVKIREQTLAYDHDSRLASEHVLARAYQANGQVQKAVTIMEHVVEVNQRSLADNHPFLLASQHVLAMAYGSNGQFQKAIALLEHVVKINEQTLTEDNPHRLESQYQLAMAYRANGWFQEAATLMEHVVKVREQSLTEDHPDRLASKCQLSLFQCS